MKKNIKISVVIPVYNVEKYIRKCLESILNQTYSNLEIIVINDGTEDNSIKIVQEYSYDKRIKIVNRKNLGVSNARNVGLKISTGEYIHFCDPDDWIESYTYELLVKEIENDEEILCFNYQIYDNKKNQIIKTKYISEKIEEKLVNSKGEFYFNLVENPCCNKLYKKDFLEKNNLLFCENICIEEDKLWNLMTLYKVYKIKYVAKSLYFYRLNREQSAIYKSLRLKNLHSEEKNKFKISYKLLEKELKEFIESNKNNWNNFKLMRALIFQEEIKGKNNKLVKFTKISNILKKYLKVEWKNNKNNDELLIKEVQNFLKNKNFKMRWSKDFLHIVYWKEKIINFKILKRRILINFGVKYENNK